MAVRIARQEDLPRILEIYAPYVTDTNYSFEYEPPAPEVFRERFCRITRQFPWLVWEEDGTILGYAYGSAPFSRAAYQWAAEPSIYLDPCARGRGIGRRLYEALEAVLTLQGYQVSYAIITSENTASLAFHRALGYTHLAEFPRCGFKHGKWLGITWLEKRLNFVEFPSNPPVSFPAIVKDDRNLQEILAKMPLS